MKKTIFAALGFALLLPAFPLEAASPVLAVHRGGHGRGWHGSGWHGRGWHGRHWGWGWGWGWGAGWGWGYPYYYPYYGYPGYSYGGPGPGWAAVDTDVSPEQARVFLDGRYIGTADDFDGYPDYLYLRRGHYRLDFRLEGFETKVVEIDARPGTKIDIDDKLAKIPGSKQYGSYETPEPAGGVRRFFGKRGEGKGAPAEPQEPYRPGPEDEDQYAPEDEPDQDRPSSRGESDVPETAPDRDRPSSRNEAQEEWREQGRSVEARPAKSPTRLTIRVEPADAAVYLDDRFIGTAEQVAAEEQGLRVQPGRHSVTVSRPGYRDRTVEVEVESGQTESVEIELER